MKDSTKLAMEVSKYFVAHSHVVSGGQGNITINCKRLWKMKDDTFIRLFVTDGNEDYVMNKIKKLKLKRAVKRLGGHHDEAV